MANPVELVGGLAVGTGVGAAIADTVVPQLESFRLDQWKAHPDRVLDVGSYARAVAESIPTKLNVGDEFRRLGVDADRQALAEDLARKYPQLPEALALWRRGYADYANVSGWIERSGISSEIMKQLVGDGGADRRLFWERADPAVVATAIQRSIMADEGAFIPAADYSSFGAGSESVPVNPFPPTTIGPLEEAQAHGIDAERLRVMTALIGLPLSLEQAASAYFRGIINLGSYRRAVAEGNTRIEWGPAALAQARQILTAQQYAELQLRGFYGQRARRDNTAKHGMTDADSDLLYDVLGRGINPHQVTIGLARGGDYTGDPTTAPQPWLDSLRRSNIRPEWFSLAFHAQQHTYPSAFVIRQLLKDGVWSPTEGALILEQIGWPPTMAKTVADHYAPKAATVDPHVGKAQTQLWSTTHRSYLNGEADDAAARTALTAAGVATGAIGDVLALWNQERALVRRQLSATQIRKAYREGVVNPATGVAWTVDDARTRLVQLGYSFADATTFLGE